MPAVCYLAVLARYALEVYWVAMLLYAVVSWIPSMRGRWSDYLAMVIEPVLLPVRRVIPPIGGFDLAFLVVLILVQVLARAIVPTACYY
ncbi:MAG: YggT family protein [Candidatus Eremiobacteraeota bacterium]|nr:YggT family protein [Candidatus Eremiobacteraeota bacterium]